ncbi:transport permease protein [Streptomyces glebosus]|uniref:Transport permease protein n=1 Tax=Streptomyces glebosus TaxID=249580 RepID=A0A640SV30_9ACTN|nr:ABC transporter permease [Streptomyces glebosus]GFE15197.1 transport permease protein [Streptomyces glebosus]GHG73029.1 transport permease protein [Streptomyces glebosus]
MSASVREAGGTERAGTPAETGAATRLLALGRAELTLLGRNKTALTTSLIIPVALAFAMKGAVENMVAGTGLSVGSALLPATLGYVLVFAVYSSLTGSYTARREELVLKRLRTGELRDLEILAGTALPAVLLGLVQCVLLVVLGGVLLDAGPPTAPHLLVAGVVLGMAATVGFAALSSVLAKSAEGAQLAVLPFMMVSLAGSGMVVPLDILPERVASVLELLPLSPAMELIRAGWTGGEGLKETLGQLITGLVWAGLALFAVQRWFRWEPRR